MQVTATQQSQKKAPREAVYLKKPLEKYVLMYHNVYNEVYCEDKCGIK
jgi:hypothetical protein